MATFKVKTFNELSGKGQNGDIAIIERADINGNQGFTFRDASGWSLPFVQVQTLGANLMTTNTSQSVSAPKTFQGEITINDDFSVIGATDIDLGFAGSLTIDGDTTGITTFLDHQKVTMLSDDIDFNFTGGVLFDGNSTGTLSVISTADINLGFTGNLNIDGGNEPGSEVFVDNVEDVEFSTTNSINFLTEGAIQIVGDTSAYITSPAITVERFDVTSKGKITFDDFVPDVPSIEMFQTVGFEHGYVSARKNELSEEVFCSLFVANTNTAQSRTVDVRSDFVEIIGLSTAPVSSMTLKVGAFSIQLNGLPIYADNAAALTDLYPVDGVYKTATGELRIVV